MKTTGMGKRILIFTLIAVIVLTMQGPRVFAGSLQPESRSETSAGQAANQPETTGEESVSQNDLPGDESVSGNDLSVLQSVNPPVVAAEQTDAATEFPELTNDILKKCIIPGMNPPGVTVNLFDYWQFDRKLGDPIPKSERDHDFGESLIYKLGISKGHLLRFGYTCMWYTDGVPNGCETCIDKGYFGAWNDSMLGVPYQGIVQNKLGAYGYPVLNLDTQKDFGGYARLDAEESDAYLSKKNESLDYLFSPSVRLPDYKETYSDVRGLFQPDGDGYYYYSSTKNFASYNDKTNSFILYNSPGVAEYSYNEKTRGEFFPFNKAEDVFDTYTKDANGNYHLRYVDRKNNSNGNENSNYFPIDLKDGTTYLNRSADILNHYLGMTMEFLFRQPENGCLSNGNPMTFEFTGDDDVWIFIDNVLVADLGGLHGPCSLDIDFTTGIVNVEGEQHTLLKSFQAAYGEHSDLGGIAFRGNTFADNTDHTLKMFYLERGHGASDLDLRFNIQTVAYEPDREEPPDKDPDENETSPSEDGAEDEESAPDPALESNISRSDDRMMLDTTGIPRTGDDSRIGWLIALCIISLSGIVVAVYNLIFIRRKKKKHSSKE